jgi:hypothetical protein
MSTIRFWLGLSALVALVACGGDDDAPAKDCATYCAMVQANCTVGNAQYATVDDCLKSCDAMPAGKDGDMAGNSVACRTYHSGAAAGDPVTHCVHAGPGGAGVCGTNCEGFCQIVQASCGTQAYADEATCLSTCALYSPGEKYDIGDTAGDTFACRLYHATVATNKPMPHCGHVGKVSSTCAPPPPFQGDVEP